MNFDFDKNYPLPTDMIREDGSKKYAFVTFLMMNDSYVASALMMAYGLKLQNSKADAVCMITEEISSEARASLKIVFDKVIEIEKIFIKHKQRKGREDRPLWFTRLNCLRMGKDGDLGLNYDKVCILDADVFPLRNYDNLFSLAAPAGMINEKKEYCLEFDEKGKYVFGDQLEKMGKWNWHQRYESICKHGERIPKELTDRVKEDVTNLGLNGSIYVFDTSKKELDSILEDVKKPEIYEYVGNLFKWPDMQYFTMRWSGEWTSIDIRFSSFNGYPKLDLLCGCHYSGFKPWYFNKKGLNIYKNHEDFLFWYKTYLQMMQQYPSLNRNVKLKNIVKKIRKLELKFDNGEK